MNPGFMPIKSEEGCVRESFHRLINARENPSALALAESWLTGQMKAANLALAPTSSDLLECKACFASDQSLSGKASFALQPSLETESRLLAFHAPLALLEGAWLQALAQPGNGDKPATLHLFAAYLALLGRDEAASPAFAYRGWLANTGVALPKAQAWRFAHDSRVGEPALRFASLQLALGLHSAHLLGETLGFTLAYLRNDSPWRLPALPSTQRQTVLETMANHAGSALQAYLNDGGDWERVRRGYALYAQAEADYRAELRQFAESEPTLSDQVADLFRRKLRFAQGYHRNVKLGGRGLEAWLAETPFDAAGFLSAFAGSPYAQGGTGQRPFDRLNAFGGPMFGVFEPDELSLIDAWLDAGAKLPPPAPALAQSGQSNFGWSAKFALPDLPPQPSARPLDRRGLFHRLINQDPDPQSLGQARKWVETVLARARRRISYKGPSRQRFFTYSHAAFAERVVQIHAEEVAKHKPFEPPPKLHREDYVFGILQFAPAILVDGSWLRHQGEAADQDSRLQRLLYRIYAEELGEGRLEWNHPKIYRDLLESVGLELPTTDSTDFAQYPGFLDSAFDLPDYLLALSLYPKTYLPETLGLNLAIELSGLGAGYMRLIEELGYWGINPLIVSLHLSIDNLAGGHSAMACEAIQIFLDEIRLSSGDEAMQATWRRVWSGYLSLDAATRRFKWALILAFCRRFIHHFLPGFPRQN